MTEKVKNERGMTLLEIMIVVIILASLMAILGHAVLGRFKSAKLKEARIQIGELSKALDMYYTDCGHYPTTDQGLNALAPGGDATCKNWGPDPYIEKKDPLDPWGHPFVYQLQDNGNYLLESLGPTGKAGASGTNGVITNQDQ